MNLDVEWSFGMQKNFKKLMVLAHAGLYSLDRLTCSEIFADALNPLFTEHDSNCFQPKWVYFST